VQVRVFVRAPYDKFVTGNTRFWHASGLDVTVDSNGLRVRTESLLSVLVGGVAFETPPELAGAPVATAAAAEATFTLFDSQTSAMRRSETQVLEHTAETIEGVRLRLARVRCPRCATERVYYYRLGTPLPS
jgi:paraquat-inducible protein B